MTDTKNPKRAGDYEVGYGKPPKHTQFVPGQSGFKGRKKKKFESMREIVSRACEETVPVNGESITMLDLAIRRVINGTIKSGKVRDLKVLFELLEKHNAIPVVDEAAKSKAAADAVVSKIFDYFEKTEDIDHEDVVASERDSDAEISYVIECTRCGPFLNDRWKDASYKARAKRYGPTWLHKALLEARTRLTGR